MDGVGSFGAGRAGAVFDPIAYIQQPTTILRLVAWVRLFFFHYGAYLSCFTYLLRERSNGKCKPYCY